MSKRHRTKLQTLPLLCGLEYPISIKSRGIISLKASTCEILLMLQNYADGTAQSRKAFVTIPDDLSLVSQNP